MPLSPDSIVILQASMIALSIIAIALRFWSRALSSEHTQLSSSMSRFWWDDWLALADLPFIITTCSINISWVGYGLGKHYETLSPYDQAIGWKLLFAEYLPYDMGISLSNISVLFFYLRIFKVNGRFKRGLWLTGSLVIGWFIFALFSTLFQCRPVSKAWLPLEPGTCINTYQWWLGSAISSLIIDFIILLLPVPMLLKLKLQTSRKILIMIVFVFGYSVIGVTIGRLIVIAKYGHKITEDFTFNVVDIGVWLSVEGPIALITISLPSIFSLARRGINHGPQSLFSTKDFTNSGVSGSTDKNLPRGDRGFRQLTTSSVEQEGAFPYARDPNVEHHALALRATRSASWDKNFNALEGPKNGSHIHVRQDVDIMEGKNGDRGA